MTAHDWWVDGDDHTCRLCGTTSGELNGGLFMTERGGAVWMVGTSGRVSCPDTCEEAVILTVYEE